MKKRLKWQIVPITTSITLFTIRQGVECGGFGGEVKIVAGSRHHSDLAIIPAGPPHFEQRSRRRNSSIGNTIGVDRGLDAQLH
jgi:hypothetical protein